MALLPEQWRKPLAEEQADYPALIERIGGRLPLNCNHIPGSIFSMVLDESHVHPEDDYYFIASEYWKIDQAIKASGDDGFTPELLARGLAMGIVHDNRS